MDKKTLQNLSYGMYVIGAKKGDHYNGQIAHRVYQISADPPTVAISINQQTLTHEYIKDSGKFTVSVLEKGTPMRLIRKFGFKSGREIDKYAGLDYQLSPGGIPYLTQNSLAYLEARVVTQLDVNGFTLFIGELTEAIQEEDGEPMPFSPKYLLKLDPARAAAAAQMAEESAGPGEDDDKYECLVCGYIYDPAEGDPDYGVGPGTPFKKLPREWTCPLCDEGQEVFRRVTKEDNGRRYREYRSDQLVVHWYPELCSHSAKCLQMSPLVFDMGRRPWVDISAAAPEEIIGTIDRCPSGALKYSLPPGSRVDPKIVQGVGSLDYELNHPAAVKIRVVTNGPLLVEGPVAIETADGQQLKRGGRLALCRCGLSSSLPFCDSAHTRKGWPGGTQRRANLEDNKM